MATKGSETVPRRGEARIIAKATARSVKRRPVVPGAAEPKFGSVPIALRTKAVADALGSKSKLATLLAVSASQPTRWIEGAENPNLENARAIVDLDHVIARAGLLWKPTVITAWLGGSNSFLEGARPIDVIKTKGAVPVIEALDQELAGAYA